MTKVLIGVPILNRPDLLERLSNSLKVCRNIGKYKFDICIVNNSVNNSEIDDVIEYMRYDFNGNKNVSTIVFNNNENKGVSASWNQIINVFQNDDYTHLIVCGNDVSPDPMFVDTMVDFEKLYVDGAMYFGNAGHNAWMINKNFKEELYNFDENFFPAYFEDNDVSYRIKLLGLKQYDVPNAFVNNDNGSQTINSDPHYRSACATTFEMNKAYYIEKWGGVPGQEKFKTPFNNDYCLDTNVVHKREYFINTKRKIFNK